MKYMSSILKGVFIGIATLVPGVSGGTMAIILGIYDDLIHAIGSFFTDWKKHSLFLFQVGLGGLLGIGLLSKLLESIIDRYPTMMQYLFIGIIIGGLPVLYNKSNIKAKKSKSDFLFLILGFAMVLLLGSDPNTVSTMASGKETSNLLFLFIAGIVIAIALILPGISASFILLTLGLYEITLKAINTQNITFLLPIGLGILVGTLASTKVIEKFLDKHPSKAYMLIIGFVLGSLIAVFPGIPLGWDILASAIAFILGLTGIYFFSLKASN
ncbi:DUF368 domain-containing protein [Clostridium sp. C8-1-8]|uniref:DUF368 domain-containing protein n=1 Tax=Clostridium sp. C8-1-8 TaxID=2698831 RepID=UPI00136CF44D|nr:DUF368 domain-containing protein [Clostridium sp. C8-1-8]